MVEPKAKGSRVHKVELTTKTMLKAVGIAVGAWLTLQIVWRLKEPIIWLVLAGFFALGLHPLIRWLERYTGRRRGLAIALMTLGGLGVLLLLVLRVVPLLVEQTQNLIAFLPTLQKDLQGSDNPAIRLAGQYHLGDVLQNSRNQIIGFVVNSFQALFFGSINFFGAVITIYILMVYFLTGGPRWAAMVKRSRFGGWWNRHDSTIKAMADAVSGYIIGNAITSGLAFVFAFAMLTILGIGSPLPIAFIYAIFDIIPLIGATLGGIMLVAIALFKSVPAAIVMLVAIAIYQQVESSVFAPRVYGRALKLPDVVVMIAAIFGGVLAGLLGALLAIPLAACIRVAILDYLGQASR